MAGNNTACGEVVDDEGAVALVFDRDQVSTIMGDRSCVRGFDPVLAGGRIVTREVPEEALGAEDPETEVILPEEARDCCWEEMLAGHYEVPVAAQADALV